MENHQPCEKIKLPYGSQVYLADKYKVCKMTVWHALQGHSHSIKAIKIREDAIRLLRTFEKKYGAYAQFGIINKKEK